MKPRLMFFATVISLIVATSSQAAFHSRLGGQAYYDDQLGITWATDTNLIGFGTWGSRVVGMSTLTIDGVSGWRLPDMDVNNDGTVVGCGPGNEAACKDNELSYNNWYGGGYGCSFRCSGPLYKHGPIRLLVKHGRPPSR